MLPLTLIVHIFLGSTIAGSAIIAALTMGYDTLTPILWAGIGGFVLSAPISWYVAKAITENGKSQ